MGRSMRRLLAAAIVVVVSQSAQAEEVTRIFAAASLTNVLNEIGEQWRKAGHLAPSLTYAASSTLAKQIGAGAPADMFAAADPSWMNYLDERRRIASDTRVDLLGNELVLIAPKGGRIDVRFTREFDIANAFRGKLCTGEPDVVPVGIYAKESLQSLGWWNNLSSRMVGTDDVRTALAFVERAECTLGIVYATDAAISKKVEIVGRFPASTHKPIVYPFALLKDARPDARRFLDYLKSSPEAAAVFERHGFVLLGP
jgi:molybdate transport system substrate-binding protein